MPYCERSMDFLPDHFRILPLAYRIRLNLLSLITWLAKKKSFPFLSF